MFQPIMVVDTKFECAILCQKTIGESNLYMIGSHVFQRFYARAKPKFESKNIHSRTRMFEPHLWRIKDVANFDKKCAGRCG